jgi:hypothetical protein
MLTTIYMNFWIFNFYHADGVGVGSPQDNEGTRGKRWSTHTPCLGSTNVYHIQQNVNGFPIPSINEL